VTTALGRGCGGPRRLPRAMGRFGAVLTLGLVLFWTATCWGVDAPRESTVSAAPLSAERLKEMASQPFAAFHKHTSELAIVRVPGSPGAAQARNYLQVLL
jgi:hypothetical protein